MTSTPEIANDPPCQDCGAEPQRRECIVCARSADIVDCGHQDQPRPLAVDRDGRVRCETCTLTDNTECNSCGNQIWDSEMEYTDLCAYCNRLIHLRCSDDVQCSNAERCEAAFLANG